MKVIEKLSAVKNRIIGGSVAGAGALVATSTTALASGTGTTETQALTNGIEGFMAIVTSMLSTIVSSPLLMVAFSASFAFLAVRLVKRLKAGS